MKLFTFLIASCLLLFMACYRNKKPVVTKEDIQPKENPPFDWNEYFKKFNITPKPGDVYNVNGNQIAIGYQMAGEVTTNSGNALVGSEPSFQTSPGISFPQKK